MNRVKISVLTPTYNRANFLKKLYQSLIENSKYDVEIEWLIMDDGSRDNTKEIVIEFKEENFNADSANKFWFIGEEGKKFFSKWIDTRFLWVAVCGGETVGYIRGYISKDLSLKEPVGYLQNIYIEPKYRGAGVGSEFVKLFKQYCQDNNCFRISVSFMEDNLNAERFYQSKGFEKSTKTYKCKI